MSTVIIKKTKKRATEKQSSPREKKIYGVYMKSVLERKVCLDITEIGKNIKNNLELKLDNMLCGKCVSEGYIKPKSIDIKNYSAGNINSSRVEFSVIFEAMVCLPVDDMEIECICKTITKAGIHAQVIDDNKNMPITMFIARDHHHLDPKFSDVKVGDKLVSKVLGIRYELDDDFICAIGRLV
jgi:DNA-directed RNA polymerase subunit E'/Rpb7